MSDEITSIELTIIDEHTLRDRIYVVRGVKVMLDVEMAEIYGFTPSAFNQQIKRNIDRFDRVSVFNSPGKKPNVYRYHKM